MTIHRPTSTAYPQEAPASTKSKTQVAPLAVHRNDAGELVPTTNAAPNRWNDRGHDQETGSSLTTRNVPPRTRPHHWAGCPDSHVIHWHGICYCATCGVTV